MMVLKFLMHMLINIYSYKSGCEREKPSSSYNYIKSIN